VPFFWQTFLAAFYANVASALLVILIVWGVPRTYKAYLVWRAGELIARIRSWEWLLGVWLLPRADSERMLRKRVEKHGWDSERNEPVPIVPPRVIYNVLSPYFSDHLEERSQK
jgi:hypothetical protein